MENTFEKFNCGNLVLPDSNIEFSSLSWNKHPTFEGVELKHIVTSKETNGEFSCHLVKISGGKKIGNHIHEKQLEIHEVIDGNGTCVNEGKKITYNVGTVSIMRMGTEHEVTADSKGLYLFAKFIPALC